jgi:hypothetical protein
MICPKCKAEYRQGYTSCADCHVLLVRELPAARTWAEAREEPAKEEGADAAEEQEYAEDGHAEAVGDPNVDPFCSFWKGTDLRVCTEICTVLDEAGIPHKTIRRQDHLFNFNNQTPYEVGVPASLYEKAELAIKDAFGTDAENGEEAVKLLPPPAEDPRAKTLRAVWSGDSMTGCVARCRELKDAGIDYRVSENRRQGLNTHVDEQFAIGVAEEDYKRALEITGGVADTDSEGEDDEEPEDPEVALKADDSKPLETARFVNDEDWHPEDATSLAWDGVPADARWMVEMSLRENDIRVRWEEQDGRPNLFVLPENEELAKRIVQEVLKGTPQE